MKGSPCLWSSRHWPATSSARISFNPPVSPGGRHKLTAQIDKGQDQGLACPQKDLSQGALRRGFAEQTACHWPRSQGWDSIQACPPSSPGTSGPRSHASPPGGPPRSWGLARSPLGRSGRVASQAPSPLLLLRPRPTPSGDELHSGVSAVLVGVGACEQVGGKCAPSVHCPPTLASLSGLPSPTHPQRKVVHQHVHDAAVYNEGNRLVAKRLRKLRHSH